MDVRWGLEDPESGGEAQTLGRPARDRGLPFPKTCKAREHLVTGRDAGEMRFGMIEVTMPASGVAIAALSPPPPTAACIVRVEAPGSSVDKLTYRFVPASELGRIAVDLPGASHTQSRGAAAPRQLRRKRDILATLLRRVVGRDGGVQGEPGRQRKRDMVRELWGRIRSS